MKKYMFDVLGHLNNRFNYNHMQLFLYIIWATDFKDDSMLSTKPIVLEEPIKDRKIDCKWVLLATKEKLEEVSLDFRIGKQPETEMRVYFAKNAIEIMKVKEKLTKEGFGYIYVYPAETEKVKLTAMDLVKEVFASEEKTEEKQLKTVKEKFKTANIWVSDTYIKFTLNWEDCKGFEDLQKEIKEGYWLFSFNAESTYGEFTHCDKLEDVVTLLKVVTANPCCTGIRVFYIYNKDIYTVEIGGLSND